MESTVGDLHILDCNGYCREIFLFSNGQHDSPPRKYHLRVNEQWDAILKLLAYSQYGSNDIIELYTVDGKKIEGPLEITDGTAYVAVEPPNAFEPAGYCDYLLKASKSREKRRERISERDLLTKPVKINCKDKIEEEHNEITNIVQDIVILPTNAAEDHNSITDKITSHFPRNVKPSKRTSTVKRTENKNGDLPQQNPTIIEQNANQINLVDKKNNSSRVRAIKKKFESPSLKSTKNTKAPTKTNTVVTNTTGSKIKGDEAVYSKVTKTSNNQECTVPNNLQKQTYITSLANENTTELQQVSHDLTVDSSPASTARKNNILPVLVNYEKDQRKLDFNPQENPAKADAFSNDEKHHYHGIIDGSPSSINQHAPSSERACDTENKQTVLNNTLNKLAPKITILIGSQSSDKSFAICVKQGSIVNLKLNVAVQNEPNIVVEKIHNNHVYTMKSAVNTSKSDIKTPQDNSVVAKNYREASVLTEMESSLEQICQISNDSKFPICKCNCCPCSANPQYSVLDHRINNRFIPLPMGKRNENCISCTCKKMELNQNNKCEIQENQMLAGTNRNTAQSDEIKIASESPEHINDLKHASMLREDHLLPKNVSIVEGNQTSNCCETSTPQNQMIKSNFAEPLELPTEADQPTAFPEADKPTAFPEADQPPEFPEVDQPSSSSGAFNPPVMDAFTQTVDLADLIVEAVRRADGSYEFQLPSLEKMKLHNILY